VGSSDNHVDPLELAIAARTRPKSFRRLPSLLGRSIRLVWDASPILSSTATAIQLLNGIMIGVQIMLVGNVLDAIIDVQDPGGSWREVVVPVAGLAFAMAVTTIASALQGQLQRLLGELVVRGSWARILAVSTSVQLLEFEEPAFYDRLQRVQSNAIGRPFSLTQGLIGLVGGLAGIAGVTAAIVALSPLILPLLLLAGLPLFVGTQVSGRLEFDFMTAQTPRLRLRHYLGMLQTERDAAKEVRAFGLGRVLRDRFDDVYGEYLVALRSHVRRRSMVALVSNVISAVMIATTLIFLVWLVAHGDLGLADAGAAIVAVRMVASQLGGLFGGVQQIFESSLFLDDLDDFLAIGPSALQYENTGGPAPQAFQTLTVEGLTFTYPGGERHALHDASLTIKSGEIVALVGENGSGKTTLAKLLAALYDPDSGTIRWDGVDVSGYQRTSLRAAVALIFQDFVRYQLTARENIGFGRPEAADDMEAIMRAARQAGADNFLQRLTDGYETTLSRILQRGHDLSIGQWQRVAIARAFFRNAPFVILDEPTASLDPRAEHELFESLRDLLATRTVLFISHRLSTVRSADRIYVLHDGKIIEHGTHDELMTQAGRYSELFSLQAAAYLDPANR
jgi:ATP-binding cassette, subfamily B, bacterial